MTGKILLVTIIIGFVLAIPIMILLIILENREERRSIEIRNKFGGRE